MDHFSPKASDDPLHGATPPAGTPARNGAVDGPSHARTVAIVGAGPGDPDLLTLRALRLMQRADVVIHDRLIGPDILDFARPGAERVFVGKAKGRHTVPQDGINALMAARARAGQRVVRLKGGDPFIFGRGGEEVEYLIRRGIAVDVVPGVTAAAGCAAAAGIPLTHRDHASAVTFVTGHGREGALDVDFSGLASARRTLVIYMGVSTAATMARRLIEDGMDPAMPAAVVENGTRADQKVVTGTVAELETMVAANAITGPAVIIIGAVVRQAEVPALTGLAAAAA